MVSVAQCVRVCGQVAVVGSVAIRWEEGAPEIRAVLARLAKEKAEFLELGIKGIAGCHCCGSYFLYDSRVVDGGFRLECLMCHTEGKYLQQQRLYTLVLLS